MTDQEKYTISAEKKKVLAYIAKIRTENERIGNQLASLIALIGKIRVGYSGINLILDELELKLKK